MDPGKGDLTSRAGSAGAGPATHGHLLPHRPPGTTEDVALARCPGRAASTAAMLAQSTEGSVPGRDGARPVGTADSSGPGSERRAPEGGTYPAARNLRNPVKVITHSTLNVIADSTVSDRLSERSDAGVGFMNRGDHFG